MSNRWHYRHPKTQQERKQPFSSLVRAKRKAWNLPTAWEDIPPHSDKCWKSHRKTKWRDK